MPGTSVRPTVRDSMLKARRRKSDATRLSTPGLSSTSATSVWCMSTPENDLDQIGSRLDQHTGFLLRPPDHGVEIGAGRHHRVHAVFLLHAEVDDHRALSLACLLHHVGD